MGHSPTLDLAPFTSPVSEEAPAGPELRNSTAKDAALYLSVRDARKRAIDAERRSRDFASMSEDERSFSTPPEPPDWAGVRRLAIDALHRSRDLWVTAWLIEALTRLHGFAGLRDGLQLALQLCEGFWDAVHPQGDGDDRLSIRFAQLAGLDGGGTAEGTLIGPILHVPITRSSTTGDFTLADYRDAVDLERKPAQLRKSRMEQGAVSLELFNQSAAETHPQFFRDLRDDLEAVLALLVQLNATLRQREADELDKTKEAGTTAPRPFVPPTSNLREILGECLRVCKSWVKDEVAIDVAPNPASQVSPGGDLEPVRTEVPTVTRLTVQTRQEAFETLLRVSEYFRQTEPHSPVSYALEQVVRWGRMSLPELLAELVADKSAREEIFRRAGIPTAEDV
jgi:type VI secretion system protein ImpA